MDRNWPVFCVMAEKDLFFVGGIDWLGLSVVEIELVFVFVLGHRNWLHLRDAIELTCFFVSGGVKIDLIFVGGIDFDFILVWDRNWLGCWAGGRNWPCVVRKWLVLSVVSDRPCFCVIGRNWPGLWMQAVNTRKAWFECAHLNWTVFFVCGRNWLDSAWGVDPWQTNQTGPSFKSRSARPSRAVFYPS